jgi:hypothetical protein
MSNPVVRPPASQYTGLSGRYSGAKQLLVEGTSSDLLAFAAALRAPRLLPLQSPKDASPYEGFLAEIAIEPSPDRVRIARRDAILVISGSSESRDALSGEIEGLASGSLGSHLHIDYYPDHPFLDASTSPLVLSLRRDDAGS